MFQLLIRALIKVNWIDSQSQLNNINTNMSIYNFNLDLKQHRKQEGAKKLF